MDITPHVNAVQEQLLATAAIGGDGLVDTMRRLAPTLDATTRLAILRALSEACADITDEYSKAGVESLVEARLDGADARFVVTMVEHEAVSTGAEGAPTEENDAIARVSLRLAADLKARADADAAEQGISLNTWIVNAIRGAAGGDAAGRRPRFAPGVRTVRGNAHVGWN